MLAKTLRAVALVAVAAFLVPASGCIRYQEELVVQPDGSGKLVMTMGFSLEILEKLKQRFPKEIAHGVIGYHVRIDEAQAKGLSVFEYAPSDRGARALAELAEELELRAPTAHGEP